jgi:ABC-type spermidine/putrescine transport system permease subunit I
VIGLVWDHIPLTVLILLSGLGNVSNQSIEAARDVGAGRLTVLWHIILPRMGNSVLVAASFAVLGIFSAFTIPYVLGPAAPEMMGPFMQRTFRELYDPTGAITQAVVSFGFCIVFGLFYVRSVARNQRT